MNTDQNSPDNFMKIVDILIRLGFLGLLVAWCFQILTPFAGVILWGIILAIAMYPVHRSLEKRFKGKKKMASTVLVLLGLIIIIIPTWLFVDSIITGLTDLSTDFNSGNLTIPPPDPAIADWPLIGEDLHRIWGEASQSIENLLTKYREQLLVFGQAIFDGIKSIGGSLVTFILAVVIAGALLSSDYAQVQGRKFFKRLVGDRGDEFIEITSKTVGNVVKGVIGVAIIQAFLVGIGLLGAGVPYAGVWTLAVLILAILQLPVTIVIIFPIIMIFNSMETLPAVLWTIYLLAAGLSDTPLKAIFLGKGAAVPMLVIFLGVIGGFIMSGFIGLFTGAIVVSLGYTLFTTWLNSGDKQDDVPLEEATAETE